MISKTLEILPFNTFKKMKINVTKFYGYFLAGRSARLST